MKLRESQFLAPAEAVNTFEAHFERMPNCMKCKNLYFEKQ